MKKVITIIVIGCFCAIHVFAQKNEYVKINQTLVNEIVKKLIDKQGSLDPVQKGWAENLLTNAFQNYFTNKNAKAMVYEQSDIKYLKDSINVLTSTIKEQKKSITTLNNQLSKEDFETRLSKVRKEVTDSLGRINLEQNASVINLSKSCDSLNLIIQALRDENTNLSSENTNLLKSVAIAENVTKQYTAKQKEIEALYMEYANSQTLDYINEDRIAKAITEYTNYVKIINVPVQDEQKKQIEYLESVSIVSSLYANANIILDSKYDEKAVSQWNQEKKRHQNSINKLNNGQKTVFMQINNAINTVGTATNDFKHNILTYLEEQGQIPDVETAKEVKDMVTLGVKTFTKGQPIYDARHKNLNKILKYIQNGLKVMNENAYKSFISRIKADL